MNKNTQNNKIGAFKEMLIFMESTDSSVVPDERYCLLYNFMNSLLDNFENKDNDDYGLWISKTADFVVNFNKLYRS